MKKALVLWSLLLVLALLAGCVLPDRKSVV